MTYNKKQKLLIVFAILVAAIFVMEPLYGNIGNNNQAPSSSISSSIPLISGASASASSYTYPTNTSGEPGYTGGTFKLAQIGNPNNLNPFEADTVCDLYILDSIYNSATDELPNGTIIPCLATSYNVSLAPANMTTFDPMTGGISHVAEIWTVHIRPGVQWDDWTSANASDTYTYSNSTSFYNDTGVSFTHTYTQVYNASSKSMQKEPNITMKTYYVQAADFVLSWKILSQSTEYSGSYSGVVNVIPVNNLTVDFYLSIPSATFVPYTLETPILPYHIWVSHDYASAGSGYWNETNSTTPLPSSGSYNDWDLGHSGAFGGTNGEYPGLVGSGPFLMNGGYGMPVGKVFTSDYWQVYENPNYFMQYVTGKYSWTHEFIPKIFSEKVYIFSSPSSAVGALSTGKVDAIESDLSSEFVSTADQIPDVHVFEKPSTGYAYFKFNSYSADAPFNITAFRQALRYASPLAYIDSSICDGYDVPGYSILPTIDKPYSVASSVPAFTFDLAKANATIASIPGMHYKAGEWYYDGVQVTATIQSPSSSLIPQIFTGYETIASDWSSIGIHTTVESESFSTIISKLLAYSNSASSPSASYNIITLGVSGLLSDPIGDLVDDFNYTAALGTGDYEGPFSAMNVSNPYLSDLGVPEESVLGVANTLTYNLNGSQIDSLMTNLTNYANTNTSLKDTDLAIAAMQYIEDEESTMMEIGYGPTDSIAYSNSTFTGLTDVPSDMNGFWEQNLFTVHLRSKALVVAKPTAKIIVSGIANKLVYYNGEYGNITFTAINNVTLKPVANQAISITVEPSLINITSLSGTTNSKGQFTYEFKVYNANTFINTVGYNGLVSVTATVVSSISGVASGVGSVPINDLPVPVAYKVSGPTALSGTSPTYYNITIYNPATGAPISGYSYTIQTLTAAITMSNTNANQKVTYLSTYDAECNSTSISVPVNSTYSSDNITSISGVTGSNGVISVMIAGNSTFNYTLNGNNYESYIFFGNYADAAPGAGEGPYMVLGEVTSSMNVNGYGAGEPFEIPIMLEKSLDYYNISVDKIAINGTTTELIFHVTNSTGAAVSGYNLNVTSQNVLGANRGYFIDSSKSAINPNYNLTTTCGPDTGSHYSPMITLVTNSNGMAYANFTSLFYSYNTTTGAISSMATPSGAILPYDEFQISVIGDGAPAVAYAVVSSNTSASVYNLTFTESGLKSGTTWYVTVGTQTESSSSSSIVFEEVNGTYAYTVGNVTGYKITKDASGSAKLSGKNASVDVTFAKKVNYTDYYIIGGIVAAIIIIGGVVYALKRKSKTPKQN